MACYSFVSFLVNFIMDLDTEMFPFQYCTMYNENFCTISSLVINIRCLDVRVMYLSIVNCLIFPCRIDIDRSGSINGNELQQALSNGEIFGLNIS